MGRLRSRISRLEEQAPAPASSPEPVDVGKLARDLMDFRQRAIREGWLEVIDGNLTMTEQGDQLGRDRGNKQEYHDRSILCLLLALDIERRLGQWSELAPAGSGALTMKLWAALVQMARRCLRALVGT